MMEMRTMAMMDSMAIMFAIAMMMTIIANLILISSIDVGGGDHFGGADPDATPLDDGEVNIDTVVNIIIITGSASFQVTISKCKRSFKEYLSVSTLFDVLQL